MTMFDYQLPTIRLSAEPFFEKFSVEDLLNAGLRERDRDYMLKKGLSFQSADFWAIRMGRHPVEIWGDEWTQEWVDEKALDMAHRIIELVRENQPCAFTFIDNRIRGNNPKRRYVLAWLVEAGVLTKTRVKGSTSDGYSLVKELEEVINV